jgi:hypothetical protein
MGGGYKKVNLAQTLSLAIAGPARQRRDVSEVENGFSDFYEDRRLSLTSRKPSSSR